MASVTEAQAITMIKNACKVLDETRKYGRVNASNFDTLADTYSQSIKGDFGDRCKAGLAAVRARLASALEPAAMRAILDPIWLTYAQSVGFSESSPRAIIARAKLRFHDTSKSFKSRSFSYGPVSAGTNAGTGTLRRLYHDVDGYAIESPTPEDKTAECVADGNEVGGSLHEEVFLVRGENAPADAILQGLGSGVQPRLTALSAAKSIAQNSSFTRYTSASGLASAGTPKTPTSITNWTVGSSLSNFSMDVDQTYRSAGVGDTSTSVRFLANDSLSQILRNTTRIRPELPYYCQVALRRKDFCDGTFTLRLGATSVAQTMSLLANDTWSIVTFDSLSGGANRKGMWGENLKEQDLDVKLELASRTTGSVYADDLIVAQWTPIDGTWYVVVGGATPFLHADSFSWADSIATDSVVQQIIALAYADYFPHSGTPSELDP